MAVGATTELPIIYFAMTAISPTIIGQWRRSFAESSGQDSFQQVRPYEGYCRWILTWRGDLQRREGAALEYRCAFIYSFRRSCSLDLVRGGCLRSWKSDASVEQSTSCIRKIFDTRAYGPLLRRLTDELLSNI